MISLLVLPLLAFSAQATKLVVHLNSNPSPFRAIPASFSADHLSTLPPSFIQDVFAPLYTMVWVDSEEGEIDIDKRRRRCYE